MRWSSTPCSPRMPPSRRAPAPGDRGRARQPAPGRHAGEIAKHVRAAGPLAPPRRVAAELAGRARQAEAALGLRGRRRPLRGGARGRRAGHHEARSRAGAGDDEAALAVGRSATTGRPRRPGARAARRSCSRSARRATGPAAGHRPRGVRRGRRARPPRTRPVAARARRARAWRRRGARRRARPDRHAPLEAALAALPRASGPSPRGCARGSRVELYYPDRAGAQELSALAVEDARASDDPRGAGGRAQRAPRRAVDAAAHRGAAGRSRPR